MMTSSPTIKTAQSCKAVGCEVETDHPSKYFCQDHWNMLLSVQQNALMDAYHPGQLEGPELIPSLEWWHAIQSAVGYLAYGEGRWTWARANEELNKIRHLIARRDATKVQPGDGPVS